MISCYLLWTDVLIDPDVGSEDTEMLGEGRPAATEKQHGILKIRKMCHAVDGDHCSTSIILSLLMTLIRTMCIFLILHFQYIYYPWYPGQVINYSLWSWILLHAIILLFGHKATKCLGTTCLLYVQASLYCLLGVGHFWCPYRNTVCMNIALLANASHFQVELSQWIYQGAQCMQHIFSVYQILRSIW